LGGKLRCPNCQREIDKQAEVQIPSSTTHLDYPSISMLIPPTDMVGVAHADLVYSDGNYFLVFPSIVTCPFCKEFFFLDIWLPTIKKYLVEEEPEAKSSHK
jgi:hypothetical protein